LGDSTFSGVYLDVLYKDRTLQNLRLALDQTTEKKHEKHKKKKTLFISILLVDNKK
jgi:hypothetical protein